MNGLPEYNGWTNYPTWLVNLWLTNDEGTYGAACEAAAGGPDALETLVEELVEQAEGWLATDLVGWALSLTDWCEICLSLTED